MNFKTGVVAVGLIIMGTAAPLHAQDAPGAYTVAEFEVTDPEKFKAYADATGVQVPAAGGKFIVRPGKKFSVAGESPKLVAIIHWKSLEQAQKYLESDQYKALIPNRDASSKFRAFVVEALPQ